MNREAFLSILRQGLHGLSPEEIREIVADYNNHFNEGIAAGRTEEQISSALGDPARLARELKVEAGLKRWESERSFGNFMKAALPLIALLAVDYLIVLPILLGFTVMVFGVAIALIVVGAVGLGLIINLFSWDTNFFNPIAGGFAGLGLLAGGIGGAAALWLFLEVIVRLLGKYVRLHYRLLKPAQAAA